METDEVCGRPLDAFAITCCNVGKAAFGERNLRRKVDKHAGIVCSCHQLNRAKGSREGTSSRFILPCRVQGQRPCWGQGAKPLGSSNALVTRTAAGSSIVQSNTGGRQSSAHTGAPPSISRTHGSTIIWLRQHSACTQRIGSATSVVSTLSPRKTCPHSACTWQTTGIFTRRRHGAGRDGRQTADVQRHTRAALPLPPAGEDSRQ